MKNILPTVEEDFGTRGLVQTGLPCECDENVVGDDTVVFPLPALTTFDGSPPHVSWGRSVQPLLAEHREERREE